MAAMTAQTQGVLYRMRRRRLARVVLQSLTAWAQGLIVSEGQYVSAQNGTAAYVATTSGTTGATMPVGRSANDGGVSWVSVDIQYLLNFLYSGAPTPTA